MIKYDYYTSVALFHHTDLLYQIFLCCWMVKIPLKYNSKTC